jgi:hypothetical protein
LIVGLAALAAGPAAPATAEEKTPPGGRPATKGLEEGVGKVSNVRQGVKRVPLSYATLEIVQDGKSVHQVHIHKGWLAEDQAQLSDGTMIFYHTCVPCPVPNPKPLKGLPEVIHEADTEAQKTQLKFYFRITSPQLREACKATLLNRQRDYFDKERSKNPGLQVEVHRDTVIALFVAVVDVKSKVMLAYGHEDVQSGAEEIEMWMDFEPESLARFLELWGKKQIRFEFATLLNGSQVVIGHEAADITYELGVKASQLLESGQKTKLKSDDEHTVVPILQGHANTIQRAVSVDLRRRIAADDSAVLSLLGSDGKVLTLLFDRMEPMDFADFQKAFPRYDMQALAGYLEPVLKTNFSNMIKSEDTIKGKVIEVVKSEGGGLGFSIPFVGGNLSSEERTRVLDAIQNVTGVRLEQGSNEKEYKPHAIRVFKLAEGWDKKTLSQAATVAVGKSKVEQYLSDTPVPQTLTLEVFDRSLGSSLQASDHVSRLLEEKRKLETDLDAAQKGLATATANQKAQIASILDEHRKVHDAHLQAQKAAGDAGLSNGMARWMDHAIARGILPPVVHNELAILNAADPRAVKFSRDQEHAIRHKEAVAAQAEADAKNAVAARGNQAIDQLKAQAAEEGKAIAGYEETISRLRQQIRDLDKQTFPATRR